MEPVDATYGGGGHSAEILKNLDRGRLFAFDQDEDAAAHLPDNKSSFSYWAISGF
jgi:16S rRNA (cytosine1402-N4)-methyltransferase